MSKRRQTSLYRNIISGPSIMKNLLFACAIAAYAFVAMGSLLDILKTVHNSAAFTNLTAAQQVLIVEMVAETEAGELKSYIDLVGFHNVLALIDVLPEQEAHMFMHYLTQELQKEEGTSQVGKRNLVEVLNAAKTNPQFQQLSAADQQLIIKVLTAAENHTLTQLVNELGYSTILRIIDILPETERHALESYLIEHLKMEQNKPLIAG